jgi:hypothetical protein
MATITNFVLNGISASGHNIYVATSGFSPSFLSVGGRRYNGKYNTTAAFIVDMYLLTKGLSPNIKNFTKSYKPIFCDNYNDNAGDSIYKQLSNFTGLSLHNHPVFSEQKYTANFGYSPLISLNYNEQEEAENLLYLASKVPMIPLYFCSSIPSHKTYGPSFINRFSISVDGSSSAGDVKIQVGIIGGKSFISPRGVALNNSTNVTAGFRKFNTDIIKMKDLEMKDLDEAGITKASPKNEDFLNKYRTMNLTDCAFDKISCSSVQDFLAKISQKFLSQAEVPNRKIVSMSLDISNNIDLNFTYPMIDLTQFAYDDVGARYAQLSSRSVTGSIKFFSFTDTLVWNNTDIITMYFGGPYIYCIKNVDWQNPVVSISPGTGYFHEYKFIARFGEITYWPHISSTRNSEFLF